MRATGFDSAWGGRQTGVICDLARTPAGAYTIERLVPDVSWPVATREFGNYRDDDHVVSIDQPIVVANASGMRPVEAKLASALMKDYGCGAHAANTANPCFGSNAGIWDLVELLHGRGYVQSPSAIAARTSGRYFVECYPHPAILGLFNLNHVVRYKVRHHDEVEWKRLLQLLQTLEHGSPAILNVGDRFPNSLPQTKRHEDAIDAFLSAYTAALLYEHGFARSIVVGDLGTGYIVTPVSPGLRRALESRFPPSERNASGIASFRRPAPAASPHHVTQHESRAAPEETHLLAPSEASQQMEFANGCVALCVIDTSNIWRSVNHWLSRCDRELLITFPDEEATPTLRFVPFDRHGRAQGGMKIGTDHSDRAQWVELSRGASKMQPRHYTVRVEYA